LWLTTNGYGQGTRGTGECIDVHASRTAIGEGHCYWVPSYFNDRAASYQLFPNGGPTVGIRLHSDYACGGSHVSKFDYYGPELPTILENALSSSTSTLSLLPRAS
jgi:hypothetical protein